MSNCPWSNRGKTYVPLHFSIDVDHSHSTTMTGRRRAKYRQPPRCISSRYDDNNSVASKKPKLASSSLRISKQPASTTFAAAVTPSSSPRKHKRTSLMSMSLPLLGEVMPRPAKRTLRSSFAAAFSSGACSKKLLPSFGTSSSSAHGKTKTRSISRLVKVNSKVKRGKTSVQPKKKEDPSSPYSRFESSDSPRSDSPSVDLDKLEIDASFTEFMNHFRGVDSGKPNSCPQFNRDTAAVPPTACTKEMEDFTLHKALSPSIVALGNTQEAASAFEARAPVEDEDHHSNSSHSIPSLSESLGFEVCDLYSDITVPQDATIKDDAADSALAWGCFAVLMGSPAPKSVLMKDKKQKKRTPVNLWQDDSDEATTEDIDDIIMASLDGGSDQESEARQEDENRVKFNEALQMAMSLRKIGEKSSMPKEFYKSYVSTVAGISPKRPKFQAKEDARHGDGMSRSISCHSIPSICEGSAELCDRRSADDDIIVPQAASNPENAADSALAWGCLT
eukprot:CAMPEP_0172302450 /NCGR_PEP_ID=MMETSP1058-20130122/4150_1 /TAXON_ID=83371 /ORGANISM="Detonula confervacea, Strain CCMP 353" /LENGTH=504 /DNA_ID=CAMNT_0013012931 /DNA_START=12 /DNA_END=1522 /DNA_ORIENTATION=+